MIDPLLALANTLYTNKGVYAVLLGSGVSRAAGVPTGWEVTLDLVRRLAVMEKADVGDKPEAWFVGKYGKAPSYSELLNTLARAPAERRNLLHAYFEPTEEDRQEGRKVPTPAHRAIARLAAAGYFRLIITTNFDQLMETALRESGVNPVVVSSPDGVSGAAPLVHQGCVVVKLHGDYLDHRILNTEDELARYDSRIDGLLDRVFDEFGLIVCGWSGEWDTALRAALERCASRRYSVYWATVGEPAEQAKRLISLRAANSLRVESANKLFTQLEEMVQSLSATHRGPSISGPIAAATVKRLVADPGAYVRYHDLILDEATKARDAVRPFIYLTEKKKEPFDYYVGACASHTEVCRHLLFNGAYFGREEREHLRPILRAIALVGEHAEHSGTVMLLQEYPAGLLFYAAGLGALASENFDFLRAILELPVGKRQKLPAAVTYYNEGMIQNSLAKQLPGFGGRAIANSEHIKAVLDPVLIAAGIDTVRVFDEFELLISLVYVDWELEQGKQPWMPAGSYVWRGRGGEVSADPEKYVADALSAGAGWGPVFAGLFGGDISRVARTAEKFKDLFAQWRRVVPF